MNTNNVLTVYCDGGSRGNPGPAAGAFLILNGGKEVIRGAKYLKHSTNNVAEYSAVLEAMIWLSKNDINNFEKITFYLDSQLVVRQLNGIYKIKNMNLKEFVIKIKDLEKIINKIIIFSHVTRDKNEAADKIVNLTIDENL